MEGLIIKNISNDYWIKSGNKVCTCKPRGKFRNDNITPVVGDIVNFDSNYILNIKPRKNKLTRPNVSNIDQAFIVTSVKEPDFSTNLLDKLLIVISYNNIKPIICLTKMDLLTNKEQENIMKHKSYYESIGYEVVINTDKNINKNFKNKVTVFTGQSGSGKSNLLNMLDTTLNLKTDSISIALGRGKHTTRHTELFELFGGYIVDTPGFSSLDLNSMSNIDIRDNMNEMFSNLSKCKYRDCMHIKEDGCEVKRLVENNIILKSRYDNYLDFIKR